MTAPDTYRGWTISYDPPPIPWRGADWRATGPNYDASYEGEEDGWVDNGEKLDAPTRDTLIQAIDAWLEENAEEIAEPDFVVWLRDLDGTGSMHVCTPHDPGAIRYYREDV